MSKRRKTSAPKAGKKLSSAMPAPPPAGGILARLRERLAGSVTIPAGVDMTAPLEGIWDEQER